MNTCVHCLNPLLSLTAKKFCNTSCAASYNNSHRAKRSIESLEKTSDSLKKKYASGEIVRALHRKYDGPHSKVYFKICQCGETFCGKTDSATYCYGCRTSIRSKNGIRSKRINYNGIMLDSTWELTVAKYLDANQVTWERPKQPVPYSINGQSKKYYPDFFLPKFNIYLDPKNPYRLQIDRAKIEQVSNTIKLIVGDVNYVLDQIKLISGIA